jgi:hypothetical protein
VRPQIHQINQRRDSVGLNFERTFPLLGAVLGGGIVACILWHTQWEPPKQFHDLLPAIINVAAIAIGFLSAALAILFTISGSRIMVHLRDTDYLRHVVNYMIEGITWAFLLAVASGAGVMIDPEKPFGHYQLVLSFLGALTCGAALSYLRIVRIFATILKANAKRTASH